jgi:hypothetical protein
MIPKPTKEALHARVLLPSKEARMFMNSVDDISKFSHTRLCLGDTTMNAEAVLTLSCSQDEYIQDEHSNPFALCLLIPKLLIQPFENTILLRGIMEVL